MVEQFGLAFLIIFIGQFCTHKLQFKQRLANFSGLCAPAGRIAFFTFAAAIWANSIPSLTAMANSAAAVPPISSFRRFKLNSTFGRGGSP